mgnify:CR=1 FL=1
MKTSNIKYTQKISQNKSFILTEIENTEKYSKKLHWHTSIELLYVQQGSLHLQLDLETYDLHASDIIFIHSSRNHALTYAPNTQTLSLKISAIWLHYILPEFFQEEIVLNPTAVLSSQNQKHAEDICLTLLQLKDIFYSDEPYSDIAINGYIFILLHHLISNFKGHQELSSQKKYSTLLYSTIQYIHLHYMDEIQMKDIADQLSISTSYISKLFHNYYSMTFKQYLTTIRLEHAVYDMIHTTNSLLDIALSCGFSSQHAFIDTFKKNYHMTPSQYKKKYCKNPLHSSFIGCSIKKS